MTKCVFKKNTDVENIAEMILELMNVSYSYGIDNIKKQDYDEIVKALWKEIYSNSEWINEGD